MTGAVAAKAGLHILVRLFGALPTDLSSALGGWVGGLAAPRLYPAASRRARALIQHLRPDLASEDAAGRANARLWNGLGRVHAEFVSEHRLWGEGRVILEGAEIADAAKASGRPVIVAGLHTGNWELLPIALAYRGHDIVQVYQPQQSPVLESVAKGARLRAARTIAARRGVDAASLFKLVPPSGGAGIQLAAALRSGWTGMIFIDDDPGGRCVSPDFLGTPRPGGNLFRVVRLAQITAAVILPAYVERTEGARFVVHFLPPIAAGSREAMAADLNASLAEPARRLIDQWFMLPSYRLER